MHYKLKEDPENLDYYFLEIAYQIYFAEFSYVHIISQTLWPVSQNYNSKKYNFKNIT